MGKVSEYAAKKKCAIHVQRNKFDSVDDCMDELYEN